MGDTTMSQRRGGLISEEDVSVIVQRYTATTVLTMLQEVSQVQDVKIDWNALVKHTKTGITNPREYQMLWRNIAYSDPLIEKLEDDAKPLDDDSDLEYELEAFPTVSHDASTEAAAYVKVLIASDSPSESCIEKGLVMEAPLMINIPKDKSTPSPSNGMNITVPVYVPTQVVPPVLTAEDLSVSHSTNTCGNSIYPPRRKRKPWTAEEDKELSEAVQRFGEGNWANLSKGEFKGDRTPSQLSQRWNIIKKRQTVSNVKAVPQLSEAQLAARRALNMALDNNNPKSASSLGGTTFGNKPVQVGPPPQFPKTTPFPRPIQKPVVGSDAVKAAAVAAGARIATQSAAAVILKEQMKSAIHFKTMGNGTGRPPVVPPGGYMGPRERFSSISPRGPRPSVGLVHGNSSVGPVTTGPNGGHKVVKDEQVTENLQKLNLERGSKV